VIVRNPLLILVVALVLLVAGLGVWLFTRTESAEPPRSALAEDSARAPATAKGSAHDLDGSRIAASDVDAAREAASTPAPEPPPAVAASPSGTATLEARFVDPNRSPIARVHALIDWGKKPSADSGSDGTVHIEIPLERDAREVRLSTSAFGCADFSMRVSLERGKTLRLGDLVLQVGGEVSGVVLGPDGLPFAGAWVAVGDDVPPNDPDMARVDGPELREGTPSTTSSARGTFHLTGVPARIVRLWTSADGMRHTCSEAIEVLPRQLREGVTLKLEALADDERIDGIVLAPDGAAVPNARLRYTWSHRSSSYSSGTSVGGDGRFRILAPKKVPFDLRASDAKNRWQETTRSNVLPGTRDLVLQLREARWIDLAVVGDSKPVTDFSATVRAQQISDGFMDNGHKLHPDGHVQVMIPTTTFQIEIVARGYSNKTLGPFDPESAPASLTAELAPVPGLRGRVTAHGDPVSGATVELHKLVGRGEHVAHNGCVSRLYPSVVESATTEADGSYRLTARDDGTFAILCTAGGHALAELSPIDVVAAKGADGLDIALVAGGAIEGRVLAAPGTEASGLIVRINRGDARARTMRTGVDGAFRFEALTPGRWHVVQAQDEISPNRSSTSSWDGDPTDVDVPWNCVVEDGRTTRFDVDLRDAAPCVFTAHVEVNHAPAAGWSLHVAATGFVYHDPPGGTTDASGDARVELSDPGSYAVTLRPPATSGPQVEFISNVTLARGANPWKTALDTGSLDATGGIIAPTTWYTIDGSASGVHFHASMPLDEGGACHLPMVLAGTCTVKRIDKESSGTGWHEAAKLDVQVIAGAKQSIVLP
jgi:hypothetical protein